MTTTILWVDPASVHIALTPTSPTRGQKVSVLTIRDQLQPYGAVTGPMFGADTAHDASLEARLLDTDRGVDVASANADRGMTFNILRDGRVLTSPHGRALEGARLAVQCYPSLVDNGRAVSGLHEQLDEHQQPVPRWRTALILTHDGRLGFVVSRSTLNGLAQTLVSENAKAAGYLDGGNEAALLLPDGQILGTGPRSVRPLPAWLYASRPSTVGGVGALPGDDEWDSILAFLGAMWLLRKLL